jgi:hypothetical protein
VSPFLPVEVTDLDGVAELVLCLVVHAVDGTRCILKCMVIVVWN